MKKITLTDLQDSNKKLLIYKAGHGFAFIAAAIAVGFFWQQYNITQNLEQKLSLFIRGAAALAIYFQSDHYRRRIFISLPSPKATYLCAGLSAVFYIICISYIITIETIWLFIFAAMMLILFCQNAITYYLLTRNDANNPLLPFFKRWYKASLGYFFVIILIAPMTYTLKIYNPSNINFPWWGLSLPLVYIDIAPGVVLLSSMILSALRIDDNFESITNELKKYYEPKVKKVTAKQTL